MELLRHEQQRATGAFHVIERQAVAQASRDFDHDVVPVRANLKEQQTPVGS